MMMTHTNSARLNSRMLPQGRFVAVIVFLISMPSFGGPVLAGSCGHYLFRNGKPVETHSMTNHVSEAVALDSAIVEPRSTPVNPVPCRGPGCRSGSIPLAPNPAPVNLNVQSELAILFDSLSSASHAPRFGATPSSDRLPSPCVDEIFRPPANV